MSARPDPLVPADVDLRDFAFMPLDVARLRDSDLAANETPEACWAAVLLWSASWHQLPAGSIPNDEKWIAKQAGYVARGQIAKEWAKVRDGALRGYFECTDGRLYHKVVAEKALDAWKGKLRQRFSTECSRIKKHNQRHGTSIPYPDFDAWFAAGCPQGLALHVPGERAEVSQGQNSNVPEDKGAVSRECPDENHSKGQGEGQGEGQGDSLKETGDAKPPRPTRKAPATFKPDDPEAWISEHTPGVDWRTETAKFRDHTFRNPISDWLGAWRNWMRKAAENLPQKRTAAESTIARERRVMVEHMTGGRASAPAPGAVRSFEQNVIDMEAPIGTRKLA